VLAVAGESALRAAIAPQLHSRPFAAPTPATDDERNSDRASAEVRRRYDPRGVQVR